ncbi:hypothetical protein XACS581_670072 [Xanthomonas citri pv. citri]|nr:hypothetical protein XACS582_4050001 [Xanthomonas citri pv. citri]CEI09656.1 hypothetical protein XACS581_670072 [Xanthomonas citri pv. citri]
MWRCASASPACAPPSSCCTMRTARRCPSAAWCSATAAPTAWWSATTAKPIWTTCNATTASWWTCPRAVALRSSRIQPTRAASREWARCSASLSRPRHEHVHVLAPDARADDRDVVALAQRAGARGHHLHRHPRHAVGIRQRGGQRHHRCSGNTQCLLRDGRAQRAGLCTSQPLPGPWPRQCQQRRVCPAPHAQLHQRQPGFPDLQRGNTHADLGRHRVGRSLAADIDTVLHRPGDHRRLADHHHHRVWADSGQPDPFGRQPHQQLWRRRHRAALLLQRKHHRDALAAEQLHRWRHRLQDCQQRLPVHRLGHCAGSLQCLRHHRSGLRQHRRQHRHRHRSLLHHQPGLHQPHRLEYRAGQWQQCQRQRAAHASRQQRQLHRLRALQQYRAQQSVGHRHRGGHAVRYRQWHHPDRHGVWTRAGPTTADCRRLHRHGDRLHHLLTVNKVRIGGVAISYVSNVNDCLHDAGHPPEATDPGCSDWRRDLYRGERGHCAGAGELHPAHRPAPAQRLRTAYRAAARRLLQGHADGDRRAAQQQ